MDGSCAYCGCDVAAHSPVAVYEEREGERALAGRFCNYGCLAAYVDAEGLAEGTSCRVDLSG